MVAIDLPTSTELTAVAESMRSVLPAAANSMFSELIVVNFWPVEASYLASDVNCIRRSQDLAFMSSLQALNYLIEVQGQSSDVSRHLVIVSRCAQVITGEEESIIPWASTAWGMRRTASLEISSVRTTAVDLCKGDDSELDLLTSEIQVLMFPLYNVFVLRNQVSSGVVMLSNLIPRTQCFIIQWVVKRKAVKDSTSLCMCMGNVGQISIFLCLYL